MGIKDNDADASASSSASTPAQQQQQQPVKKAAAKPVQTPAKQDPEPISDPEGPLSPELQKELVEGTIPALPGDYVETFCKAFAVQFKTGNKKIRNCFTHYKHYTWSQDYFAKHPLEPVEGIQSMIKRLDTVLQSSVTTARRSAVTNGVPMYKSGWQSSTALKLSSRHISTRRCLSTNDKETDSARWAFA